ncbi:TRAP transporter small permease subunit [Telmatospirillum sp. J64-1]|uniref:TRAP transporter small permease subunit n=1 Tax=Telmatospirillum sp. J64-1 TaxID=2502183 RepID=UPI0021043170|nr:TRAP transporter small permease [Telmatospirillum sp. J64-1]
MMISLSFVIAAETILRKFFSFSFGGVDELGGYAVAIAAPLAFTVAAVEQSHIRINLLYTRLPEGVKAALNALAAVSMGILSLYLLHFTLRTVRDTQAYQSIAQTPWATPLIYPQSIWLAAMALFAVAAVILSAKACYLLLRRDWTGLNRRFGPGSVEEELQVELDDLKKRGEAKQ